MDLLPIAIGRNLLRFVRPNDCPEFAIHRALPEDKLKLELRAIASLAPILLHSGIRSKTKSPPEWRAFQIGLERMLKDD